MSHTNNLKKLLKKRIPAFAHSAMVLRPHDFKPLYTVYVQTCDLHTVLKVLDLHLQRCQLSHLRTWLIGYPDYTELQD